LIWAFLALVFGIVTAGFILLIAFKRYGPCHRGNSACRLFPAGDDYHSHLLFVVASPDDRAGGAGPRRAQNRDPARPHTRRPRYSSEPGCRLAQARSAARRRHSRRRRRDGMVWARPTGGREQGAEWPSQACTRGLRIFNPNHLFVFEAAEGNRRPLRPLSF